MVQKRTPKSHAKDPGHSPPASNPATAYSPLNSTPATPFTPSSSFQKSVFFSLSPKPHKVLLFDWWLFGAETDVAGKRLAVGGLNTRGQHATRVFNSAPIIKRFDAYTLETADGITVRIQGFINKSRTHHNGVPVEVAVRFLTGFPYNWEVYADEFFGNKPSSTFTSKRAHNVDEQLKVSSDGSCSIYPIRLDEFPMSKVLDALNSTTGTSVDDLLKKSFTPMSKGNLDVEQTPNSAEFGIRRLSNDLLPEKSFVSPPTPGSRFRGYTLRSQSRAGRIQVHNTGVTEGKDPEKKVDNSFSVRTDKLSGAFLESDVRKPHDVSNLDVEQTTNPAEFGIRRLPNDLLPEKSLVSPPKPGSRFRGYTLRSRSTIESSGDPKGPPSNDIDEVCYRIHEKLEKCTFIARKDSNTQVAAVNREKTSKMGEILLKKPLTKSTGSRRKDESKRQENIQLTTDETESVISAHHSDKDTALSNISSNELCGIDEASGMIEKDTTEAHTYWKEIQSADLDGGQQVTKNKAS